MPRAKKAVKVVAKKSPTSRIEVEVNNTVYKGEAETLEQAFKDYIASPAFPKTIKTRAIIKFTDKKGESRVVWPTVKARRQFNLMTLKPYWAEFTANKFGSRLHA